MIRLSIECHNCLRDVELDVDPADVQNFKMPRYWCSDEVEANGGGGSEKRIFCTKRCMKRQRRRDRAAAKEDERARKLVAADQAIRDLASIRFEEPPVVLEVICATHFNDPHPPGYGYELRFSNGLRLSRVQPEQVHLPQSLAESCAVRSERL